MKRILNKFNIFNFNNKRNIFGKSFSIPMRSFSSHDDYESIDTDVLIVGGGVAGMSLAAALLKTDFFSAEYGTKNPKIIVIDHPSKLKSEDYIYKYGRVGDARVVSLTPASIRFLRSIGLWKHLDERLIKYVKGMQVWENKGSSYVNMNADDSKGLSNLLNTLSMNNKLFNSPLINSEFLCATIEINHLLNGFNKLMTEYSPTQIQTMNMKLEYDNIEVENGDEYAYINLNKEKKKIRSKLLIASDGNKSIIRSKLKIPTTGYSYNETGLVCALKGNRGSDIAYQRFLHNGIFALLPLYDDLYSIVCSMPKNINENLKRLEDKDFVEVINKILHNPSESDLLSNKLDRLIPIQNNFSSPPVITEILSKRFEFPLQLLYAQDSVHKNTILLGDASHAVHPLAGQGLNLGLTDSSLLANELVSALQIGRRLNDKRTLESYSFKVDLNTKIMVGTLEAIKTSFIPTNYPFAEIRNLGLSICNKSSFIKSLFVAAASGEANQPITFAWDK